MLIVSSRTRTLLACALLCGFGFSPAAKADPVFSSAGATGISSSGVQGSSSAPDGNSSAGVTGNSAAGVTGTSSAGVTGNSSAGVTGASSGGVPGWSSSGATGISSSGVTGNSSAGATGISSSGADGFSSGGAGAQVTPGTHTKARIKSSDYSYSWTGTNGIAYTKVSGYVASVHGDSIVIVTPDNKLFTVMVSSTDVYTGHFLPGQLIQSTLKPSSTGPGIYSAVTSSRSGLYSTPGDVPTLARSASPATVSGQNGSGTQPSSSGPPAYSWPK